VKVIPPHRESATITLRKTPVNPAAPSSRFYGVWGIYLRQFLLSLFESFCKVGSWRRRGGREGGGGGIKKGERGVEEGRVKGGGRAGEGRGAR
jgi:hypothetical protein